MRIAVLGAGRMGAPIARRLTDAGEVVAYDPAPNRRAALGAEIATASTLDDALAGADVVVAVLPGAREQREVLLAAGATEALRPGVLVVDLTSGHPDTAREAQRAAQRAGAGYVAAPMGGGPAEAADGALRLWVGGTAPDVERAGVVFDALAGNGGQADHVSDDAGAATLAKLLVNGLWFAQAVAVAEAVRTGEHAGLPASVFRDALRGSAADSAFVERYLDRLLAGDEMTEFSLDRVVEELEAVETFGRAAGIAGGVLSASHATHARALSARGDDAGELTAALCVREGWMRGGR